MVLVLAKIVNYEYLTHQNAPFLIYLFIYIYIAEYMLYVVSLICLRVGVSRCGLAAGQLLWWGEEGMLSIPWAQGNSGMYTPIKH